MASHDWQALVARHARATGAGNLPPQTIDELAAHLEDLYLEGIEAGLSDSDAFGSAEAALQESALSIVPAPRTRTPASRPWAVPPERERGLIGLSGDLRFAWRQMRRAPSFAIVAIVTLGLGAGAATAIFTVVNTILLRPLPFSAPQQLVMLWEQNLEKSLPREHVSPVNFMDYRAIPAVFQDAAAWWRPDINLADPGAEPVRVSTIEVSGNVFEVLGVSPALGAGFPARGPFYSRDLIAVISDRLWREHYHSDPSVIGKPLRVSNGQYTIAGVMPPGFNFPDDVDLWLRLNWDLTQHSRGAHFMQAIARMKPGVTVEQASRELSRLTARLGSENPATNRAWNAYATPLLDDLLGYYRLALIVLLGAVALVLLTACLNVASLLLARATARAREIAVRAALGASRARLVRQMLVESLLLSAAGTAAGAAAAFVFVKAAVAWLPMAVPRLEETTIDARVLAFTIAVVAVTAVLFGLLPAVILSRTNASEALKAGTRMAGSLRGRRWNRALVVSEVALACAVLLASALLVRSVSRMLRAPIGIVSTDVVVARVQVSGGSIRSWDDVEQFYAAFLDNAGAQPGVEAVGAATALPLDAAWATRLPFGVEGTTVAALDNPLAQHVSVTPGYFETLKVPLAAGRLFTAADTKATEPVIVVNETFARRVFPGGDAVGRRIISKTRNIGPLGVNLFGPVPFRIIGVVGDIQHAPIGRPAEPAIYHTARQFPFRPMHIVARGRDHAAVAAALRQAVRAVDPSLPLSEMRTMDERVLAAVAAPRLLMFVLTAFAVITAALAGIGVYGLLACVVNDRRREMAIRMALGARPAALARNVAGQGLLLVSIGVFVGLSVAQLLFGRLLTQVLFETRTTDPVAAVAAAALLLGAAVIACTAPARRAATVAPLEGLKSE